MASVLHQELSSLLLKGAIEDVPQSDLEQGFFSRYFLVPKRDGGLRTHSRSASSEPLPLQRDIMSQIRVGDWFVSVDLKDAYFHIQVVRRHRKVPSVRFWREGLSIQSSSLWPGFGTEDVHEMHGCYPGPVEAPGHSCTQLPGRSAHSGPLQRVSELSQGWLPRSCSWPPNKHREGWYLPFSTNCVFGSSLGFRSDAGPSGSCPDFQSQYMAHFKLDHHVSVSTCRRLLDLMAAASPVLPLGLLHMRPFLWWMKLLGFRSTGPATRLIRVLRICFRTLLIWQNPLLIQSGVRMVMTDAFLIGWGAV